MLYIVLGILLLIIIIQYLPPSSKEGYTNYNEISCQSLAKQNQENIASLQADVKKLLEMGAKVDVFTAKLEGNAQQLKLLTEQVYKVKI